MKTNIAIGLACLALSVVLALLNKKGILGDGWLAKADQIASVISMIVAILAFLNPFGEKKNDGKSIADSSGVRQSIEFGDSASGNVVGQSHSGNVTIGDVSTSAAQRAEAALVRAKTELLNNFSHLSIAISTIEKHAPAAFWDIRRANEAELQYQDRAKTAFRDYQAEINLYLQQLKFSKNVYEGFQRDLSHNPNLADGVKAIYDHQNEAAEFLRGFETGLQHFLTLNLNDVERTAQSSSLHKEKVVSSKIELVAAAGRFCTITNQEVDIKILSDALILGGISETLQAGAAGYQTAYRVAAELMKEKAGILQARTQTHSAAAKREIDRRLNDPYLIMLRKTTGLPPTLTEAELSALEIKKLDIDERDPEKLLTLAAHSYLEADGHAAILYLRRALDAKRLSPLQESFVRLSLRRLQAPEKYEGSIGMMVAKLTPNGNFEKSGLQAGDVIITLNGGAIQEPFEIASALAKNSDNPILLGVIRGEEKMLLKIKNNESAGALLTQLIVLNAIQL